MKKFIKTLAAAVASIAMVVGWLVGIALISVIAGNDDSTVRFVIDGYNIESWALTLSAVVYCLSTSLVAGIVLMAWVAVANGGDVTFKFERED